MKIVHLTLILSLGLFMVSCGGEQKLEEKYFEKMTYQEKETFLENFLSTNSNFYQELNLACRQNFQSQMTSKVSSPQVVFVHDIKPPEFPELSDYNCKVINAGEGLMDCDGVMKTDQGDEQSYYLKFKCLNDDSQRRRFKILKFKTDEGTYTEFNS